MPSTPSASRTRSRMPGAARASSYSDSMLAVPRSSETTSISVPGPLRPADLAAHELGELVADYGKDHSEVHSRTL